MTNSYSEMVNEPWEKLEIAICESSIFEWVEPTDRDLETSICLIGSFMSERYVFKKSFYLKFPNKNIKAVIIERDELEIKDVTQKFPVGFMSVSKEEIYFRIFVRRNLFSYISTNLSATENGCISLSISVPEKDKYEIDKYYPILSYGIDISRKSLNKSKSDCT